MPERYDYDRDRYGSRWEDESYGRGRGGRDRGFFERAGDEVRSWFGDDEAERRRRRDEREGIAGYRTDYGRYGRGGYGRETYESGGYGRSGAYNQSSGWGREGREGYTGGSPGTDFGLIYGNRGYGYGGGSYGATGEMNREYWGGRTTGQRQTGPYVGRGPKGYRRSDERIREDINDRLTEHPYIDATNINVAVKDGEVTLDGSVDSREMKRMAEDVAETVGGVKDVQNHIRVSHEIPVGAETGRNLTS